MSERITGNYDDALYKSTYTLLYFTLLYFILTYELACSILLTYTIFCHYLQNASVLPRNDFGLSFWSSVGLMV